VSKKKLTHLLFKLAAKVSVFFTHPVYRYSMASLHCSSMASSSIQKRGSETGGAGGALSTTHDVGMAIEF
jgi:hypothetical protein